MTVKKQRLNKPLILSAATRASAGNWRDPNDESRYYSNSIEPWIKLAKLAERGKLHSIFFVDHLSWFDVYGSDFTKAAELGTNAARIDPSSVISALSLVTKNLGFGVTLSTVSEHPYHFARRLASLDHLTKGRLAWNIVASYLPSAGDNLLNGAPLPEHDERYVKTEEYLDVLYELLLSSWRDDAIVYDKKKGIFADPSRIRTIDHKGKYFDVKGPAITEPTKDRFPLISQAGSSKRGKLLAAENAELVYISNNATTKKDIEEIKRTAKEVFGRDPNSIKFILPINVIIGRTHEEAVQKQEDFIKLQNPEEPLVYLGGTSGIDASKVGWDEVLPTKQGTNGVKQSISNAEGNTKRQFVEKQLKHRTEFLGTPSEIADLIEETILKTGADGINFQTFSFPTGLEDLVNYLIPELQRRGLAQKEYAVQDGTFRENLYGEKGQYFVKPDHPAFKLRWNSDVSKERFEKELKQYIKLRDQRRHDSLDAFE